MEQAVAPILDLLRTDPGSLPDERLFYGQPDHPRETGTALRPPEYIGKHVPVHIMPEICCVISGRTGFMWQGRYLRFRKGDICLVPRMVPHFEKNPDRKTPYETVWISCTSTTRVWISRARWTPGSYRVLDTLHLRVKHPWLLDFAVMDPAAPECAGHLRKKLDALFSSLRKQVEQGNYFLNRIAGKKPGWRRRSLEKAMAYIEEHLTEKLTLRRIAAQIRLSPSHFSAVFKKEYGDTVFERIIWYRLDRAVRMLGSTDLTVSEIAHTLRFRDVYYFSRLFKKNFGITPTAFRDQCS